MIKFDGFLFKKQKESSDSDNLLVLQSKYDKIIFNPEIIEEYPKPFSSIFFNNNLFEPFFYENKEDMMIFGRIKLEVKLRKFSFLIIFPEKNEKIKPEITIKMKILNEFSDLEFVEEFKNRVDDLLKELNTEINKKKLVLFE